MSEQTKKEIDKAVAQEYRRIRKIVVSMRVLVRRHLRCVAGGWPGEIGFYSGQEDAMGQLLTAIEPKPKSRSRR